MSRTRIAVALAMMLSGSGCVSPPRHAGLARAEPVFSPSAFFSGRTEGEATLKIAVKGITPVHVEGDGHVELDGTLVLIQRVRQGDKPATTRTWHIRSAGPGHYTGTLTGTTGPVAGEVSGNLLHLRFTMKGGLDTEQWLYLQPGGQVALNRMVVRKFGVPVAALSETIRKR